MGENESKPTKKASIQNSTDKEKKKDKKNNKASVEKIQKQVINQENLNKRNLKLSKPQKENSNETNEKLEIINEKKANNASKLKVDKTISFLSSLNLDVPPSGKKTAKDRHLKLNEQKKDCEFADINALNNYNISQTDRMEMISIFNKIVHQEQPPFLNYINIVQFRNFLLAHQKENKTEEECKDIISSYETDENCKTEGKLTINGLIAYLIDPKQHIVEPKVYEETYHDMNLPLQNYFINSFTNSKTVSASDGAEKDSSYLLYMLKRGCRFIELYFQDDKDGRPSVFDKFSSIGSIKLENALTIIRENAFMISKYPLIIHLNFKSCTKQKIIVEACIEEYLKDLLYNEYIKFLPQLPSPYELQNKILLFSKNCTQKCENSRLFGCCKPKSHKKIELNVLEEVTKFESFKSNIQNNKPYQYSLLNESDAKYLVRNDTSDVISYTNSFLTVIQPTDTGNNDNYKPIEYWNCGFQIVGLDSDKCDNSIQLNEALFSDNGGCGYILKPEILRNGSINPFDGSSFKNKTTLLVKVLSAQNVSTQTESLVVIVSIYGVQYDCHEEETGILTKSLKFTINCPELAFVRFTIKSKDGSNQYENTIRFQNIRNGYRHISLKDPKNQTEALLFVVIEIDFTDSQLQTPFLFIYTPLSPHLNEFYNLP